MALTSTDETDLLLPLHSGLHEEPRFATFLARLLRRTGAEQVALLFRHGDAAAPATSELFAGRDLRAEAAAAGIERHRRFDHIPLDRLRPGRVYAAAEFADLDPAAAAQREAMARLVGVADERAVRVGEHAGVGAWLVLSRAAECTASDSALLSSLAPYVAAALRSLTLIERQRIDLAMADEGLARAGAGWLLLDRQGRVIGCDPGATDSLQRATRHVPVIGERLRGLDARIERRLVEAAEAFALNPDAAPRATMLALEPRLEALLTAPPLLPATALARPAMLALCRFDRGHDPARVDCLAELYKLPRREAELAVRLSDGQSLAEAGEAMGLTLESTRAYSKQLYGKLGVRGQAELVRAVYESGAALA